jgi:hypothetical protein
MPPEIECFLHLLLGMICWSVSFLTFFLVSTLLKSLYVVIASLLDWLTLSIHNHLVDSNKVHHATIARRRQALLVIVTTSSTSMSSSSCLRHSMLDPVVVRQQQSYRRH